MACFIWEICIDEVVIKWMLSEIMLLSKILVPIDKHLRHSSFWTKYEILFSGNFSHGFSKISTFPFFYIVGSEI